jgi:23S rRNA (uracil1939-C5)-methyltransferase
MTTITHNQNNNMNNNNTTTQNNIPITATIESIDIDGKGVTHIEGKAVFVLGALPNETVTLQIYKKKASYDMARLIEIIKPSSERVTPECPNFGVCGGCSLQHIDFNAQIKYKQQILIENLTHIGRVSPSNILPPLVGTPWGYRHRARLSARYVNKKASALIGFREKNSHFVADMKECLVLPQYISDLIPPLRNLLEKLSIRENIPQIEIALGTNVSVLLFRIMEKLSQEDIRHIKQFTDEHNQQPNLAHPPLHIWLQPDGLDSCHPFYPEDAPKLSYALPEFNLVMPFYPTEFTQINPVVNQQMVRQAINLLELHPEDNIVDFFCGIGNFTLPIATIANSVVGIEGNEQLVSRARENAKHNKLDHKTSYLVTNLFKVDNEWLQQLGKKDKWLIDPPRDGALELIRAITPEIAPKRIVYISCNPATLARDAGLLVNTHGYTLTQSGVMNMFPHTSHSESIAVFELPQ